MRLLNNQLQKSDRAATIEKIAETDQTIYIWRKNYYL